MGVVHVCVFACERVKGKGKFRVLSYLFKQSQKLMYSKSILPTFSVLSVLPVPHESLTVYLHTTMRREVEDYAVLFSMKRASLAKSLSEYFIHILGFTIPIFIHVLWYMW